MKTGNHLRNPFSGFILSSSTPAALVHATLLAILIFLTTPINAASPEPTPTVLTAPKIKSKPLRTDPIEINTPVLEPIAEGPQDRKPVKQKPDQPATKPEPQPDTAIHTTSPSLSIRPPVTQPKTEEPQPNSLGMKFLPVARVKFCIWQTRVQDFAAFAKATKFKSNAWLKPGFPQADDHPVVNVSWNDATAFCRWLTEKEHKDGTLPQSQIYRLPTDQEWSVAVGLPEEPGRTPEARDMSVPDVYPWGTQWPPPLGAGNYTGEETGSDTAIKGYADGHPWTSPVGSFEANQYGLYDMGGNVWQWCDDWLNARQQAKVLRGSSWYNGSLKLSLLSSCRLPAPPGKSADTFGFRCVIAPALNKQQSITSRSAQHMQ